MKIDRAELLSKLYEFAISDSGLIVGKPGIGKSFLIRQLKNALVNKQILSFIIRIDNLVEYDDDAISSELGIGSNWLEKFKKIKIGQNKAVLIFDAFDAARDEKLRKGLLTQIRRVKRELSDKWHVLVSVRTYDAMKSPDLIELFSKGFSESRYPRRFDIPELSEEEVFQVIDQNAKLGELYTKAGAELKVILHNPFFLEIMDRLITDASPEDIDTFKLFRSESQLLNIFWSKKITTGVDAVPRQLFLSVLTENLINNRTLSYNMLDVLKQIRVEDRNIFDYLRSENILEEIAVNNSRIAFAHNILFDYAVSRLAIHDDYHRFLAFIEADLTRPFFLRPSFVYFFSDLWFQERNVFWDFYFKLLSSSLKEIQLFIRLVLNGIIASQFANPNELNNLINADNSPVAVGVLIRNLLQSIRFVRTKSTVSDNALLSALIPKLSIDFIFDFGYLLDRTISENFLDDQNRSVAGATARDFLTYLLDLRKIQTGPFIERIAAQRGVELVCKTYDTNPKASHILIARVLDIINEPNFEIGYFVNLADDVQYILPADPATVAKIYTVIFGYQETSTETTDMSASVVLRLSSNRKQDFEMSYYRLQKFFPEFLANAPEIAIPTGLNIVNHFVAEDRNQGRDEDIREFEINGDVYHYQQDYSAIWGDNTWGKPSEMAQAIIKYFSSLYEKGDNDTLQRLLPIYRSHAVTAYTWKLLFKFYRDFKQLTSDEIFHYVTNQLLLFNTDVSFDIRALIEKYSPEFTNEQIEAIEKLTFKTYDEQKGSMIARVLSMLPADRLQSDKAKEYMLNHERMTNEPPYSSSGFKSSPYTTDDWLTDQGVDMEKSDNKDLAALSSDLEKFNYQYLNHTPSSDDYDSIILLAKKIFERIKVERNALHKDLFRSVLGELAKFVAILSRDYQNIHKDHYDFIHDVVAESFAFSSAGDEAFDDSKDVHFTFSPTPRNSAAEALVNLYIYNQNEDNRNRLMDGLNNANHIVRFNTVRNLQLLFSADYELYKLVIKNRLINESNAFVYSVLLSNLIFKKDRVAVEAEDIFRIINTKANNFDDFESFVNNYVELLLYFMHDYNVQIAHETLWNAYGHDRFCQTVIFRLFENMHPAMPENNFIEKPDLYDREIAIIRNYIEEIKVVLQKCQPIKMDDSDVKIALMTLDKIVQRIYFVLQPKSYGNNRTFEVQIPLHNKAAFYFKVKPILKDIIEVSENIIPSGIIIGHTAHYFMQIMNEILTIDPRDTLAIVARLTRLSLKAGYTFDSFAIQEVVNLTEKLLADHRDLLLETAPFNNLLDLLDIYINSGWINALELLWRLDEVFR